MQRDENGLYGYDEEMQNLGLRSREHERLDQLPRQERALFGLNDEVLRRREALNQMLDDNGFAQDEEN